MRESDRTAPAVPPSVGRHRGVRLLRVLGSAVLALGTPVAIGPPAGASLAHAAPAEAGAIGLRLVDVPVAAADDPRARLYIVDHLAPGAVIRRRIEISNTTSATARVALYASAGSITDGSFVGAAGRTANELSTWTSVRPDTADVPAGAEVTATVTIAVPADAAPGEQYGVAWAEVRSAPGAGGVSQVSRVGLRLYVSVGPGGAPAADFTIDALVPGRAADGRPAVLADVHNTGGRALDMNGRLDLLAGPGGLRAGPFPAVLGTTLGIGETEQVRILLDPDLPAGPWDARIVLRSGLVERSARATITFPAAGTAPAVATAAGRPGWLYPAIAASILLVLVAVLLLLRRRRRARLRRAAPTAPHPQEARMGPGG